MKKIISKIKIYFLNLQSRRKRVKKLFRLKDLEKYYKKMKKPILVAIQDEIPICSAVKLKYLLRDLDEYFGSEYAGHFTPAQTEYKDDFYGTVSYKKKDESEFVCIYSIGFNNEK